jgi:energy-coupling factor transport system substrate-specific component
MATISNQEKKAGLGGWNTRDLLVAAVIGIVFGLIAAPLVWLWSTLEMLTGPIGSRIIIGIFYTASLMAAYIIRRPGAAFLATFIFSLVQVPLTPYGWASLAMVVINGVPVELAFAIVRYRRWSMPIMMTIGASVALLGFVAHAFMAGYLNLAPWVVVVSALVQIATGAFLGGWLAKVLVDSIAKSGVLSGYAVGEVQEEI